MSVTSSSPSSIWGSICKKVYSCNKPDKRHSLYLKWRKNSHDIRTLVRDALNKDKALVSLPNSEEQFHVSCSLSNFTIQRRASLVTFTILKEISSSVTACFVTSVKLAEYSTSTTSVNNLTNLMISDLNDFCSIRKSRNLRL